MARQLRSRASRPNYAALFQHDDSENNDNGPSNAPATVFEDVDGGSDFALDEVADAQTAKDDDDLIADSEGEGKAASERGRPSENELEGSIGVLSAPAKRRKSSGNASKTATSQIPGLAYSSSRQTYTLPNVHHRHRPVPVFDRSAPVERLLKRPEPFTAPSLAATNSWSTGSQAVDRIGKSWGLNVGPGPLWDVMEDRSFFKESLQAGGEESEAEKCRRPRVYHKVVMQDWDVLSSEEASSYLPHDVPKPEDTKLNPPPPVPCSFGPYGKQVRVSTRMFETHKIADFIPKSKAHVFNAGAPVWALDWCPLQSDDRAALSYKQYIAVAPFPTRAHSPSIGVRAERPSLACIQIWSLEPSQNAMDVDSTDTQSSDGDPGEMRCEMVLCIDSGPAFELKWCPLPSNDPVQSPEVTAREHSARKLGILAGTFEDGSLSLYVVPDPASVKAASGGKYDLTGPAYVRFQRPLIRLELEETLCWGLDWANSEVIAVGCTNGNIAVYNLVEALNSDQPSLQNLLPTHYFTVHQSAVRALAWVRAPVVSARGERSADNPTVIASGGYDGMECLTDIRELAGNVMNRTRDVINSMCYSPYCGGPVTIDHENIIKSYSVSPLMLGRGHMLLEPDGPTWCISASDYHPQLAVGVTDGSCITTNIMRTTRRGGAVPFLAHKIYQLDYSRKDGEWRMLEKFLPQESIDRLTAARNGKKIPVGTGAWPKETAVQCVVWNSGNGLAAAPYLASSTGSGLCRVDWVLGRWMRDRVPYGGIEGIRGEVAGLDEDDEESD
ncbi:uncharacterized protein LAESUDRAFT_810652 [Laetiporus sulphureus 93-53]|uniref:WD40 repeat-like protein n=1 Tax=Laetiporus sulphureus 93-53 TaxID=1314785 RepID=A0A165G0P1_9APHY|nr:uncharacterized protein LAESUDRAFT_810652 [Laetiporus sulphureus 93-53]KZT09673.1 hypothetical protein LAESUDRAFT_810652 [Laetiporus sulphureus 93-53]